MASANGLITRKQDEATAFLPTTMDVTATLAYFVLPSRAACFMEAPVVTRTRCSTLRGKVIMSRYAAPPLAVVIPTVPVSTTVH